MKILPPCTSSVALIALHGVGDPKPGDTAQAVAKLLVAQAGYQHNGQDQWQVKVTEVFPESHPAPPSNSMWAYSSRFTAARLGSGIDTDEDKRSRCGDLGLELNYHLLRGTQLPDEDRTYVAGRHRLQKNGHQVDVVDLYWGDLSGLSGAVTRIIAELFTLIFHLCQLGRDAAHQTAWHVRKSVSAKKAAKIIACVLAFVHEWADTLFTKPSGLFNALLVLLVLWWFPLRMLQQALCQSAVPNAAGIVAAALLWVLASLAVAAAAYWRERAARWLLGTALVLFGVGAWVVSRASEQELALNTVAVAWALLLALVYGLFIRFCEDRMRGMLSWGTWLGALVLVAMLVRVGHSAGQGAMPVAELWAQAMMQGLETVMLGLVAVWALFGVLVLILVLAGRGLKCLMVGDAAVSGGVDTGRIGLYISVALFVTLACAAWAFALKDVSASLPLMQYHPFIDYPFTYAFTASEFLEDRFKQSTLMFAPVVLVLLGLMAGAISLLFPSVVAEINPPKTGTCGKRPGRWLSGYGHGFTVFATSVIFACAFLFAAWALVSVMPADGEITGWRKCLADLFKPVHAWSAQWLNSLTYLVAGSAAGLLVVGAKVFGSLRNVRGALDTALDVDRHFREFPDVSTPRGRIAARFLSVLTAAKERGYSRIVVCAHSQGTVIAAELLRELKFRDPENMRGLPPVYLFTCGSPLRQLYEARFPVLYQWVVGKVNGGDFTGPRAADLGVKRWTNVYNTGDYVGRWLWESPDKFDPLKTGLNYEEEVYRQFCLGAGAHTHYYDAQMATVANEIDALIVDPCAGSKS